MIVDVIIVYGFDDLWFWIWCLYYSYEWWFFGKCLLYSSWDLWNSPFLWILQAYL